MQYRPYNPWDKYTSPLRDPITATAGAMAAVGGSSSLFAGTSMALTAGGGFFSAISTIMGGDQAAAIGRAKKQLADSQAEQLTSNAAGEIAAAQRQALDTRLKTQLLGSQARAGAAASGIDAGSGSALTNQKEIAGQGEYHSLMDLWQGENRSTGDLNQAAAVRYGGMVDLEAGEAAQRASVVSAFGTGLTAASKSLDIYGGYKYGGKSGGIIPSVG